MIKSGGKTASRGTKGKKTYDALLLRAAELFARNGYDGVGLQEIAAVAGVTKGSLYYHFQGKRHIYMECVELVINEAYGSRVPPIPKGDPEARLEQYVKWLLSTLKGSPLARRLLLHMIIDHDIELMHRLMTGPLGESLKVFMGILRHLKLDKDKAVLAYFFYAICILNHELVEFADIWLPGLGTKIGDIKATGYLKSMIESW